LEWEVNTDLCPPAGTPVVMIFEPAGEAAAAREGDGAAATGPVHGPIDAVLVTVAADGSLTMDRKPVSDEELSQRLAALQAQRPTSVRISAAAAAPLQRVTQVHQRVESTGAAVTVVTPAAGAGAGKLAADEQR